MMISDIITIDLIFLLRRSIIALSPLFSSKKIDSARFNQRAFFCPQCCPEVPSALNQAMHDPAMPLVRDSDKPDASGRQESISADREHDANAAPLAARCRQTGQPRSNEMTCARTIGFIC
jgi:hypothetical protein